MSVKITVTGLHDAKQQLRGMSHRAQDLRPAWPKVGSYISQSNRKQFTSKGAYYGTPWKPLKPEYAAWKLHHGHGRRMLVVTGTMKMSFTSRPMSIEKYYRKKAVFGSDNRLAAYHQYGTRRNGKRAIPARPMMKATPKLKRDVAQIVLTYVVHGKVAVKDFI